MDPAGGDGAPDDPDRDDRQRLSATRRCACRGIRIDGADGIRGKSVVVHRGATGSLDAEPGVPNNRVACGVIETNKPLEF